MKIEVEILNSVIIAFSLIFVLMSTLFTFVRTARARLLPCIILLALFIIALQAIGGRWLLVGISVLFSSPYFIMSFSDRYIKRIISDENPEGEPVTL